MANSMHSFIADGFSHDCDELIHQCLKEVPVTYKVFSKVFRDMGMTSIYLDRQSGAEIAELSEEVINIAKHYLVANTSHFEETVIGLFLVYALIKTQPFEDFGYLRLVEDDVPYIERLEQVARREKRVDVLCILGRVLCQHTRYLAAARERGMEPAYRKYLEGCSTADSLGLRPKGVFLRQNEELDIISELERLQLRYDASKNDLKVPDLHYINKRFPFELDTSLKNIISGLIHNDDGTDGEEEEISARTIKEKAMKTKVNPIKHLMRIEDRSPKKQSAAQKNTEATGEETDTDPSSPEEDTAEVFTTQNIKSENPAGITNAKTVPSKTGNKSPTKKATTSKSPPKPQKRKRQSSSNSETTEESDISLEFSDHDSDCNDIDLDNFDKANSPESLPNTPEEETKSSEEVDSPSTENDVEVQVCNRNLNFGALPCILTSEDNGKTYQIEVIDKLVQSTKKRKGPRSRFNSADSDAQRLRKEKKDLKKTILKSRFKRMGIEPIANFKGT